MEHRKSKKANRLFLLLLACVLALGCAGCGKKKVSGTVRVGAMKGPTSMGLLFLMDRAEKGETELDYTFEMATGADELLPLMAQDKLDIALVPANVASVLYQKMQGGVCVIDINTLGVLYLVTGDAQVESLQELGGRTVWLTGKGTTPDYVLQYLLAQNGITDCVLEYKSEPTEVAAALAAKPDSIGLLPQPFATAACIQNGDLRIAISLNDVWEDVLGADSGMVTGVTIVRKAFWEEHPELVGQFLKDHSSSVEAIAQDPETGAQLCEEKGIVAKAAIAKKALPQCNLVCVTGESMRKMLEGYLHILYEKDPQSVGGTLPGDDFYLTDVK